jgi:hypothetical protein
MAFQYTTFGGSTLDGAINDSVTTLDVVSAASFPTSGDFWINIEGEILKVTGVSSNTFTVVRGETGGTAAASHSSGVAVIAVVTAQAITQLRADMTRWGTYATMDALTDMKSGDVFWFDGSDTPYTRAIYNGSSWDLYYQGHKCTPLVTGDFGWENQDTASFQAWGGATVFSIPKAAALRGLFKAEPATPYTIRALVRVTKPTTGSVSIGLGWRNDSLDDWINFLTNGTTHKWTFESTFSAAYTSLISSIEEVGNHVVVLEISDDGTDRICRWGQLGEPMIETLRIGNTDFLTADQVGVVIYNNGAGSFTAYGSILSWEQS